MQMRIEEMWRELEAEAQAGCSAAWLTRYALPQPAIPFLIGLETIERRRVLLLPLPKNAIPPRGSWPECQGLELVSVVMGAQFCLGIRLRDQAFSDVFNALAEDVAPRVVVANTANQAATVLLERLRCWQQFLTASREGLSVEAQRGLWGELHVLRTYLLPTLGVAAVDGWKAGLAAHQDFQFPAGAIEVKTTTAKQPQAIRITSERQLDDTGVGSLFLHAVIADERNVGEENNTLGQSLSGLVAELHVHLANNPSALAMFNDRLFARGWLDGHAQRYENRRWAVRTEHSFRVGRGFPRLTEASLPAGVGDVSYIINLAACSAFETPTGEVMAVFLPCKENT